MTSAAEICLTINVSFADVQSFRLYFFPSRDDGDKLTDNAAGRSILFILSVGRPAVITHANAVQHINSCFYLRQNTAALSDAAAAQLFLSELEFPIWSPFASRTPSTVIKFNRRFVISFRLPLLLDILYFFRQ